ncbi:Retrovirus-related Pol polyprotein from transposon TNT 1-94 [Cardamine amara subsp. amara]|uniref:Retrovirus-related Pol polyprotein from transposon TNT 1-94 n=1 Tax=Cardamine amara subsp. amara TaxID=228776 RepID=A0ABD1A7S1_CARAN
MATANTQDAFSDDLNYEIWAQTTKATLIEKGLWDVVENGVSQDPSKIPELAATIQAEELSKWRDLDVKDTKALQILQSSLTDSYFRKTLSSSSAKDVWDLLKKGNEEAKVSRLEKQFEELKRYEGESVDSYIDRIEGIVEQLSRLKIEKSEYQICMKVFTSLPGSFDGMASVLKELMDVHHMTCNSLGDYFNFNGYEFDSATEEDFLVLLNNLRLQSKSDKSCDVCYKNSHNKEDCKMRNEEKEEEIVVEYKLSTEVSLGDLTYDEDIWMIYEYAKATNHMTPYEKYFTTLDRTHRAGVELADGKVIMVEGRGDVKIMMKGGKKKTIKNVLFVPKLNRNVLSFGQMMSRGYSFEDEGVGIYIIRDRTGEEFGETLFDFDEKRMALRLKVVEGNLTS